MLFFFFFFMLRLKSSLKMHSLAVCDVLVKLIVVGTKSGEAKRKEKGIKD